MSAPTNEERAATARAALESQPEYQYNDDGLGDAIIVLVADLLHLAHQNDIEPDYVILMAQEKFWDEAEKASKT